MKGLTQLSLPCPRNIWTGGKQLRSLREALAAEWPSSKALEAELYSLSFD